MSRTALYRHFDAAGALLYVGISNEVLRRLCQHKERSHWFTLIVRVEIEWCQNREAALIAEAAAIRGESPTWNIRLAAEQPIKRPAKRLTYRGRPARKTRIAVDSGLNWYVLHPRSGRVDGWYCGPDAEKSASEVLDYFTQTFPGERFELRSRPSRECPSFRIAYGEPDGRWLHASESHLWARS